MNSQMEEMHRARYGGGGVECPGPLWAPPRVHQHGSSPTPILRDFYGGLVT